MPFIPLRFKPGLNRDQSNYSNEGGWWSCDKVRFRQGYPEKIGGWAKYTQSTVLGVCRALFGWVTSFTDNFLAMGTSSKFYIDSGGNYYDITPVRETQALTNPFDTSTGSAVITVNDTAHGADDGAWVTISGSTAVGGIPDTEINAEHQITYVDADSYTITVSTAATSTVTGGGGASVSAAYQVNPGYATATYGYGWGTGTWGRGTWGSGSTTPVIFPIRIWFIDNFDNDLVFNYNDGGYGVPYYWARGSATDPSTSLGTRAIPLSSLAGASDTPTYVGQVLVSQNDKHLLAFGATPYGGGDFDPMLIRWASQDAPENWTPEATNTAGFIRVSKGSIIKRAIATRQEILVFTDTGLNSLQFTGTGDVFALQELNNNISLMGPNAVTTANGIVFWMGHDKFYAYTGRVETLPTTLWTHVFTNLNHSNHSTVVAGTNEGFNEIWWFYTSGNSQTNDSYVVYNYVEKVWYYGSMERTAWIDSGLREYPQGIDTNGQLYNHEDGNDADGVAMDAYIQSADFDIGDGEKFMMSRRILPDMKFTGSTASTPTAYVTVAPRRFPGASPQVEPNLPVIESSVDVFTDQVFIRARGRSMAFKVGSNTLGTQWQLGNPRLDAREDGRR